MNFKFAKNQLVVIFFALISITVLLITVLAARQRQEIRKKAQTALPAPSPIISNCDNDPTASIICGWVFDDANGNGLRDIGETTGFGALDVQITYNQTSNNYRTTTPTGWYQSQAVVAGDYEINLLSLPSGYTNTTLNPRTITVPSTFTDPQKNDLIVNIGLRQGTITPSPTGTATPTTSPAPTGPTFNDTTAPNPPQNVTAVYDSINNEITFEWRWTGDLPIGAEVGYCQRCRDGDRTIPENACSDPNVQGFKSDVIDEACDPYVNSPFWWQIVDETQRDPVTGAGTILVYHYSGANKTAGLTDVQGNPYPPGGTKYIYSCDGRTGNTLRVDTAARDANGNITVDGNGVPSEVVWAKTVCGQAAPTPTVPVLPAPNPIQADCDGDSNTSIICGWVFDDLNGNGLRDTGETSGFGSLSVQITGSQINYTARTTTPSGWYQSQAVTAGTYGINLLSLPTGYTNTTMNPRSINFPLTPNDPQKNDLIVNIGLMSGAAPTPTISPPGQACDCVNSSCSSDCGSNTGFACSRPAHCTSAKRGEGDANGDGAVDLVDYDYYRRRVWGDTSFLTANPDINTDFDGDGLTSAETDLEQILLVTLRNLGIL